MKWYLIQCISNKELQVKESIEHRRISEGMEEQIGEVYVPIMTQITKTGKLTKKPIFPGYIYIKMNMTDEAWYVIRNTKDVTGLVGSSGQKTKPAPISEEQIEKIRQKVIEVEKSMLSYKAGKTIDFKEGDLVEIANGPASGQKGTLNKIDIENGTCIVSVEMFGRITTIDVQINAIKKAY